MLTELYSTVTSYLHSLAADLSGNEPMAKGLIVVGILGAIAALCRNFPRYLWKALLRRCTVSVKVEDKWEGRNKELYKILGQFIAKQQVSKNFMANAWSDDSVYDESKIAIVPDYGAGLFTFKGIPFYYVSAESKEKGSVPGSITLTTLGRDPSVIWNNLDAIEKLTRSKVNRKYYISDKEDWIPVADMGAPPVIFLPKHIKSQLDEKIDFYMNNKEWYTKRGISHKLLIVLHGEPGTGKSAISRYVADRIGVSLGTIPDDHYFSARMREATVKEIVVSVPDFDTLDLANNRMPSSENENSGEALIKDLKKGKLNEVLNLFQGDIPINGLVVVMSTNCIEKVDPALLRRGRTDLLLEIGALTYEEVNEFYKHHYEKDVDLPEVFKTISVKACDLQGSFEDNPFDENGFTQRLLDFVK